MTSTPPSQLSKSFLLKSLFAFLGVSFGLVLLVFGGWKLVHWLDHAFPLKRGRYKAQLLSNRIERSSLGDLFYHAKFDLSLPKRSLKVKLRLAEDKSLYRYLAEQKWGKVYKVRLAMRPVTRRWTLTYVDNVVVGKKRKTKEGVIYLGLFLIGGALIFAAIKNYLQQRLRQQFEHVKFG